MGKCCNTAVVDAKTLEPMLRHGLEVLRLESKRVTAAAYVYFRALYRQRPWYRLMVWLGTASEPTDEQVQKHYTLSDNPFSATWVNYLMDNTEHRWVRADDLRQLITTCQCASQINIDVSLLAWLSRMYDNREVKS